MKITQTAFDEMRRRFTEDYFYALAEKAGGQEALLKATKGKPRGQVEFIVDSFFPEGEPNVAMLDRACKVLLDQDALMDGLGALPWGDES